MALDLELLAYALLDDVTDEDHVLAVRRGRRVRALEGLRRDRHEALVVEVELRGLAIAVLGDIGPDLRLLTAELERCHPRHLRPAADSRGSERDGVEGGDGVLAEGVQEIGGVHEEQVAVLVDERLVTIERVAPHLLPDTLDDVLAIVIAVVEEYTGLAIELGVAECRELGAARSLVLAVDALADRVDGIVVDQGADVRGVALGGHEHRTVGVGEDRHVHELRAAGLGAIDRVEDEHDLVALRADGVTGEVVGIAGLRKEGVGVVGEARVEFNERDGGQHDENSVSLWSKNRLRAGLPQIPTGNANSRRNMPDPHKLVKD